MKLTKAQKAEFKRFASDIKPEEEAEVRAKFQGATKKARIRGAGKKLLADIRLLWKMLVDGDYDLRWETKAMILFALLYFTSPLDVIPDPLPGVGYLDDTAVVAWVLYQVRDEVKKYRAWKECS